MLRVMTIVLSWLTHRGIVMTGDSALTAKSLMTGQKRVDPDRARKVFWHQRHGCGLAAWGAWDMGKSLLHEWMVDYLASDQTESIAALAKDLAARLTRAHGANLTGRARAGVHIAGYEPLGNESTPAFYHVHDGGTQAGFAAPPCSTREEFEAVQDVTPSLWQRMYQANQLPLFRNGDLSNFVALQDSLNEFQTTCRSRGFLVPFPETLERFADYAVVQVRLIADLYQLSNVLPGIGGRIDCLSFTPRGMEAFTEWAQPVARPRAL
jgi:hypothetical protein